MRWVVALVLAVCVVAGARPAMRDGTLARITRPAPSQPAIATVAFARETMPDLRLGAWIVPATPAIEPPPRAALASIEREPGDVREHGAPSPVSRGPPAI